MMDPSTVELFSHVLKGVAILNILSGIPASLKMWRTGNTEGWPTLFFIVGFVGASGMVHYGVIVGNPTLMMLNAAQSIMNLYYIFSYIFLARNKGQAMVSLVIALMYMGLLYLYAQWQNYDDLMLSELLGSSSGAVFFVMNSVPILDVINSYNTKRADFDMMMLTAGMANAALWLTYGLLLNNVYIFVPCLPFLFTGVLKIMQMFLYRNVPGKSAKKTQ